MRFPVFARGSLAAVSVALGALGLAYKDFAPLGQAFPIGMPGRDIWLYGSASVLLIASTLCLAPTVLPSVLIIGTYEAVWGIASSPAILKAPLSVGAWYGFFEAMSALVAPWIVYVAYRTRVAMPAANKALEWARSVFGLTCVFYGYSHFAYADYTASMVPTWLPGRLDFAYLTGFAHIVAGVMLFVGLCPRLAATLEALMMSSFGLLVWVPSFFIQPVPKWATPRGNQWSELVVTVVLATSAWLIAASLEGRFWALANRSRV